MAGIIKNIVANFFLKRDRNYVLVSQIISAFVALISGKLIAIYVSPEKFGLYGIQFAILTLFSSALVLPALNFTKANFATIIPKIGLQPFLRTIAIVILIAFVLISVFFGLYFEETDVSILLLVLLFLIFNTAHTNVRDYLNVWNRLIVFSNAGLVRVIISLILLFVFLRKGENFLGHVEAIWIMQIGGAALAYFVFLRDFKFEEVGRRVKYSTFIRKYFHFAWPLGFSALWIWFSNYFDRFAIEYLQNLNEVGIYSANYGVGSKFFLVLSPIFIVLVTPIVFGKSNRQMKRNTLIKYGAFYSGIALPILLLLYYTREMVGQLLLSSEYSEGFYLIFWIALAFFLITLAQLFELYFYSEKRTYVVLISNISSAIINISLNLLLIPSYGIFGAAIATCGAFVIYLIVVCFFLFCEGSKKTKLV